MWAEQQEEDTDLQPVLQWLESGRKSLQDEVAGCSSATKELVEICHAPSEGYREPERNWPQGRTGGWWFFSGSSENPYLMPVMEQVLLESLKPFVSSNTILLGSTQEEC